MNSQHFYVCLVEKGIYMWANKPSIYVDWEEPVRSSRWWEAGNEENVSPCKKSTAWLVACCEWGVVLHTACRVFCILVGGCNWFPQQAGCFCQNWKP